MALTHEQVKHIASLARLDLSAAEVEKFTTDLSNILAYMEQLSEVDTKDVEPTAQVTGLVNISRTDEIEKRADPDLLLKQSPNPIERHSIKVKPIFGDNNHT